MSDTAAARTLPEATHEAAPAVGPSVVLACYDRTAGSSNALAYSAGIAGRSGARLVILSVEESMELGCPPGHHACLDRVATEAVGILGHCSSRCEVTVESGDPASVIQRVASELRADLVVVDRSRRPWLHPLGSVPARLVRLADQPVLVVP